MSSLPLCSLAKSWPLSLSSHSVAAETCAVASSDMASALGPLLHVPQSKHHFCWSFVALSEARCLSTCGRGCRSHRCGDQAASLLLACPKGSASASTCAAWHRAGTCSAPPCAMSSTSTPSRLRALCRCTVMIHPRGCKTSPLTPSMWLYGSARSSRQDFRKAWACEDWRLQSDSGFLLGFFEAFELSSPSFVDFSFSSPVSLASTKATVHSSAGGPFARALLQLAPTCGTRWRCSSALCFPPTSNCRGSRRPDSKSYSLCLSHSKQSRGGIKLVCPVKSPLAMVVECAVVASPRNVMLAQAACLPCGSQTKGCS